MGVSGYPGWGRGRQAMSQAAAVSCTGCGAASCTRPPYVAFSQ
ncbi:hypothetical protein [Streptomyces thermoviolaceus]|nr:hypothetical protein [Streptomyces thermoviolaceus]WTD47897.1 hypothetical protein OG899_10365 [Streptomyces thermoviolaceus]